MVLLAIFMITVGTAGYFLKLVGGRWIGLWVLVAIAVFTPLAWHLRTPLVRRLSPVATGAVVIVGVFVLRAAVIFSAQS